MAEDAAVVPARRPRWGPRAAALWRRLPRNVRYPLLSILTPLAAPAAAGRTEVRAGPLTVAGLFSTATGLGESARLCYAALQRLGLACNVVDLSHRIGRIDLPAASPVEPAPEPGEGGLMIVHLNPPHLPIGLVLTGRNRVCGKRVVGYWAWELETLPRAWRRGLRYVHEVWVPSEFVAGAVRRETGLPVRVVPHPVAEPPRSGLRRADFDLSGQAFVVFSMLDMASGYARKNPLGAVRAFRSAFGDDPNALLVIKIGGGDEQPRAYRELCDQIGHAPNIRLMHAKLSRHDYGALLACSDAVLSLHRSEGFGLVLAEAMRLGKPVVATAWSGNMQFMTGDNAALVDYRLVPVCDPQRIYREPGARWAEPDLGHAAAWLEALGGDVALRQRIGAAARADAARLFDDAAYGAAIAEPLAAYGPRAATANRPPAASAKVERSCFSK